MVVNMEPEGTDSYFWDGEGDEPMARLTASLTRKFSIELSDGQWESAEASFSIEEERVVEDGQNYEDAGRSLRAFVKALVRR
jgi:hypothetical protein